MTRPQINLGWLPKKHSFGSMKYASILLCFLILSCGNKESKKETPEIDSLALQKQEFDLFIDSYESLFATHYRSTGSPGAALVIVKDTEVVLMNCYGVKELDSENIVDSNSVFRLASLSKGFTGILTGILVEKGILNWNDKVVDYLPGFKLKDTAQTNRIEIRHLLSHSTGMPRHAFGTEIERGYELEEIMQLMRKEELEGKEGETYAYQNSAFSLIDLIIQVKTGKTWRDWMQELILDKLPMRHASLTYEAMDLEPNKALPHFKNKRKKWVVGKVHERYYNVAPAAAVNASISDMAVWLQLLLGNRPDIVNDTTLDRVFSPFVEMPHDEYYDRWEETTDSWYGMGWRVLTFNDRTIVHHGGYVNSYRSEIAIDRENKIGICVLFNSQNACSRTAIPTFLNYYDFYQTMKK